MFTTIIESLADWNTATDARQKLQHTYLVAALVCVLGAGLTGLVNYELGQKILLAAFLCVAVFLVNAIAWALLQSFVLLRLSDRKPAASKQARKK